MRRDQMRGLPVTVAALFVATGGVYFGLPDVDPWDERRDARRYDGTAPVVGHPPCERWGRYWSGGPSARTRRTLGDDGGGFASALAAVRRCGGVLEHPEASHAFAHHGIARPRWRVGWEPAGDGLGHVCCVAQGHYGHRARKLTWLYAVGIVLPELDWSIPPPRPRLDYGFHSAAERAERRAVVAPIVNASRLTTRENLATPIPFRDLLLSMARTRTRRLASPPSYRRFQIEQRAVAHAALVLADALERRSMSQRDLADKTLARIADALGARLTLRFTFDDP